MNLGQSVLVIDDDPLIHKLVTVRIKELNASVHCADRGEAGVKMAHELQPDLILLDVSMPDMTGFDVCERLRNDPLTRDIPIIFLTGTDDSDEKVRAFEIGAVDYVTKPFNAAELRSRVRAALRMQSLVEALETQAQTDHLTGLPNREAFRRATAQSIEMSRRESDQNRFALLFLDLDRFKLINDSLGHAIGDELLIAVANKLYDCVRRKPRSNDGAQDDVVARMGGDEFAILLNHVDGEQTVIDIAERIRAEMAKPYVLRGYQVNCGISVGIRMCDGECDDADSLLRDSDTAMYHAKAAGKGRHAVFDKDMHEQAMQRLQLENDLRQAIDENQFELLYQPIVTLGGANLCGFESLIRWNHPTRGRIQPDQFIPVAEETGMIAEIGRWALREACGRLSDWSSLDGWAQLYMGVNLSKIQLKSSAIVDVVDEILNEFGIEPSRLQLEVTESVIMFESRMVVPVLERLSERGLSLVMDDFGTGYSSLASLHRFPLNVMKIDRDFIQRLSDNRPYAAIVHAIITLAHNLDLKVVAEGIETAEQLAILQTLECDLGQGFHFSEPVSAEQAERMLTGTTPLSQNAA